MASIAPRTQVLFEKKLSAASAGRAECRPESTDILYLRQYSPPTAYQQLWSINSP
jgi:hypothetical protein